RRVARGVRSALRRSADGALGSRFASQELALKESRHRALNMNTRIDEIADGIYRISTFVAEIGPDGFTFNQFLIRAEQPLLFHTGPRAMFPAITPMVARVVP